MWHQIAALLCGSPSLQLTEHLAPVWTTLSSFIHALFCTRNHLFYPFYPHRSLRAVMEHRFQLLPRFVLRHDSLPIKLPASWMLAIKPRVIGCATGFVSSSLFFGCLLFWQRGRSRRELSVFAEGFGCFSVRLWRELRINRGVHQCFGSSVPQIWNEGFWESWWLCRLNLVLTWEIHISARWQCRWVRLKYLNNCFTDRY